MNGISSALPVEGKARKITVMNTVNRYFSQIRCIVKQGYAVE
jgi:hypothetical protein